MADCRRARIEADTSALNGCGSVGLIAFEEMAIGVHEESGVRIVEGTPENLTPRFFDLSSGEAGEILDKLRRFQVRLAIVCSPGIVQFSSRFREILSDDLGIFETCADARLWLAERP
jgi:hypothetical protein